MPAAGHQRGRARPEWRQPVRDDRLGTFTGIIVFDRLRKGGLRQLRGRAGCVSGGGAGGCTPARAFEAPHGLAAGPAGIDDLYTSSSFFTFPGVRHGSIVNLVRESATGVLSQPAGTAGCITWSGGSGCASTTPR